MPQQVSGQALAKSITAAADAQLKVQEAAKAAAAAIKSGNPPGSPEAVTPAPKGGK